jgi:hypothetical protein
VIVVLFVWLAVAYVISALTVLGAVYVVFGEDVDVTEHWALLGMVVLVLWPLLMAHVAADHFATLRQRRSGR